MSMSTEENKNQLVLPFDVVTSKVKDYAQQSVNITFAKQKNISILAKKIMAYTISLIDRKATKLEPYYKFHVNDLNHNYKNPKDFKKDLKKAYKELVETSWYIQDVGGNRWAYYNILNTTIRGIGYDSGYLIVSFNPLLEPYFIELARYSNIQLRWFMSLQSWYSMRIMECLSTYRDTGKWYISLTEFRKLMDCEKKLKDNTNMINKTVVQAQTELEKTPFAFTYEKIFENKKGGGRPKVVGLEFTLKRTLTQKIPKKWYEKPEHAELLTTLTRTWRVEENNIAMYGSVLKPSRIRELIKTWKLKELSNNRINDRKLYCNKTFVAEAKKYIQ